MPDDWKFYARIAILAQMAYPNDSALETRFALILQADHFTQKGITQVFPPDSLAILLDAPSRGDVKKAAETAGFYGYTAGRVLYYAMLLEDSGISEPSINKAIHCVKKMLQKNSETAGSGISANADVRTYWGSHKKISHLWASWIQLTGEGKLQSHEALSNENLEKFLATAEAFRLWGESCVQRRTKRPIFAAGEALGLPQEIHIDPVRLEAGPCATDAKHLHLLLKDYTTR